MDDERYCEHEFSAPITVHRLGTMTMRVVFRPEELAARPPCSERPRLRFEGEIADLPIRAAWQPAGPGRRCVMLGETFRRDLGRKAGDVVDVRFRIVGDDDVPMPPSSARATAMSRAAARSSPTAAGKPKVTSKPKPTPSRTSNAKLATEAKHSRSPKPKPAARGTRRALRRARCGGLPRRAM